MVILKDGKGRIVQWYVMRGWLERGRGEGRGLGRFEGINGFVY